MSVENKIKELLSRTGQQLTEETTEELSEAGIVAAAQTAAAATKKDSSKAATAATAGDATQPMQGSSEKASFVTHAEDDENLGAKASASVSKDTSLPKSKGDAKSVKTPAMEEEVVEGEAIVEEQEDIAVQLNTIFGEELSEEFKTKATSIFEAAVIARVNHEMEAVINKLQEQNEVQINEFKASLVDKIDGYLSYIVEQWMEENKLAVETGLRTEITEDFISGLKVLFKEHYIEVPEEKFDVLEQLQSKADQLEAELNESISLVVETHKELTELKRAQIFEENTKDLADTEVEKLKKLVEGVEFESEEVYSEKLAVIKESYFPKTGKKSPEQVLVEESGTNPAAFQSEDTMTKYVQAISRTLKSR